MTTAHLRCPACGSTFDDRVAIADCARCGGLLDLEIASSLGADALREGFASRRAAWRGADASGVWRYRELVLPTIRDDEIVSWPEGNTPLVEAPGVARWAGHERLLIKHEGMNPTGSFKDRGMTVAVSHARRVGAPAVACASTGNTSASLAAYAALAGIPSLVLVPAEGVALGKMAQTVAYGARTLLVRSDFDGCLALARQGARELGIELVNSVSPFRLAGQRTITFELLDQLGWDPPDWIALPAGNLGNTAALGDALRAALAHGLIARLPRILAVQAAGAAPFAQGFAGGFSTRRSVRADTVATAIRIGDPASWDRAVRAIRETDGIVVAVRDDEILEAKARIDAAGIGCEPASAASVAGVRRLTADGTIGPQERVVAILTGHVLKDPGAILAYHRDQDPPPPGANRPIEIEPSLDAVRRVLERRLAE